MELEIFSKRMAEDANWLARMSNLNRSHIWISVSSDDAQAILPPNENRISELFLKFDDLDKDIDKYKCMSESQADQIIKFVTRYEKEIDLICVNCNAGISRSAGIAAALDLLLNGKDNISSDKRYHPNIHVKSLLLKTGKELFRK